MIGLVILGVLAVLGLFEIYLYNRLVRLRNLVRSSWSDIDVLLKKRHDLVGNLVETVRGYAAHEQATLTGVTEARSKAAQATGPQDSARAENVFKETLKSLFAVVESYPALKADAGFLKLQGQLQGIEDGIEDARRGYNGSARDYNNMLQVFPSNLLAGWFSFAPAEFFELAGAEREPVKVKFA